MLAANGRPYILKEKTSFTKREPMRWTVADEHFQISFDENGQLSIELSAEYLETLGKGEHTIILKIGGIEIEFVIVIK